MLLPANDPPYEAPDPEALVAQLLAGDAHVSGHAPIPVPGSRLGHTVPVAMPGGPATADEAPGAARGMLGQWYGWPVEIGVLVLLAALFIWAMTLEPVQELDPAPKAGLRLGPVPGLGPLAAPAALGHPAQSPRA